MQKVENESERQAIETLKQKYTGFPKGEIRFTDRPDYIVRDEGKTIGIEITQAVHSPKAKMISNEQKLFTDLVIDKLINLLPFHFSLTVDLDSSIGIPKAKKDSIAAQVANVCALEFSSLEDVSHAELENEETDFLTLDPSIREHLKAMGLRNLPKGVKGISIFRCDAHNSSFNSAAEAGFIPRFTKEKLVEILADKHEKLKRYQICDEFWLVIWQGGGLTGYFKEINFDKPISTTFDKVFIVRGFENDFIILKGV